ncbi:MAG: carbohydrate ABC transporter permease [Alicyclobacillus sp.]|nr:carbohydrate ABC transporter permease [Alicyclobacillus sp.]
MKRLPSLIGMIIFAVLQLFPLIWLVDYSLLKSGQFYSPDILQLPHPPNWQNYVDAFVNGHVLPFLLNSLLVCGVSIAVTVFFSITMGYAFTRMRWKFRRTFLNLILLGMIIPIYSTLLPNFSIFSWTGILNTYWALILPYIAFSVPVGMYIMTGYLETIPSALEEAAVMDGLSIYGVILRIIVPAAQPAIATITVMTFLSCWNEFVMAITFISSDAYKTLPFALMQFTGEYSSNYGAQFAVMTLMAIPSVLLYALFTEQVTRGVTAGAVKG